MAKRFKSKVDGWILITLIVVVVVDTGVIVGIALHPEDPAVTTATILLCIAAMVLIMSLLIRTYYSVDKNVLRIVSGPFRWIVPLDRLMIRYGKRRKIMVSPADKHGFLRAIGQEYE